MSQDLEVVGLGRIPYTEALELQRRLAKERIEKRRKNDLLLLVEHPPVVTLGRGFRPEHLSTPQALLQARGIEVHEIERGGDVTFHGPGQLVGYPIFDLTEHRTDLHWFLRQLEQALIVALEEFGIEAGRREGYTGVWVLDRKIASIGIHVRQWVTWHGFALNVTTDLSYFDLIVPCGIPGVRMTSIQKELEEKAPRDLWARTLESVVLGFAQVFGQRPQMVPLEEVAEAIT
ncbi:MAG: octanoyltransferase [Gemmatimonadales bacterium]|nr:Octanoyltransferase [bacterium HR33]GIW51807.1 MAG: octanoyltransferase [Gemmatimonadales bacterium]